MIELRGMTWNHPRGLDPLVAHAREYENQHGVRITWDARSLEDFEAFPLDELAQKYDLLVIDHPHVGMAAASGCLLPFDSSIHLDTVGKSHESYNYEGRQWALAIDAATQVAACRADSLGSLPRDLDEVLELARPGRVLCPLAPVHALMCFFTFCAHIGKPCGQDLDQFVNPFVGQLAMEGLRMLALYLPEFCFTSNPIDVFERMVADKQYIYAPLIYGYVSYSREGFRSTRIEFGPAPSIHGGSTLGGTGIAVSARSKNSAPAVAVAIDLASPQTQRGIYAQAGGQPAHRDAWLDDAVNAATLNFYRNTIADLDNSYLRPRFNGYIAFQARAGELAAECVRCEKAIDATIDDLNTLYRDAVNTK